MYKNASANVCASYVPLPCGKPIAYSPNTNGYHRYWVEYEESFISSGVFRGNYNIEAVTWIDLGAPGPVPLSVVYLPSIQLLPPTIFPEELPILKPVPRNPPPLPYEVLPALPDIRPDIYRGPSETPWDPPHPYHEYWYPRIGGQPGEVAPGIIVEIEPGLYPDDSPRPEWQTGRQPQGGTRTDAVSVPTSRPGATVSPAVRPAMRPITWPSDRPQPHPQPQPQPMRQPAKWPDREVKIKATTASGADRLGKYWGRLRKAAAAHEFGTEVKDFVKALHDALPKKCQKHKSISGMLLDLYNCGSNMDWADAIENLLYNEVEDRIVGKAVAASDYSAKKLGFGTGAKIRNPTIFRTF